MKNNETEITGDLYNLLLNPATRDWERSLLRAAKTGIDNGANFDDQIAKLEAELRPLALRNNLTPDVTDFYLRITDDPAAGNSFDLSVHYQEDGPYQARAIFAGGCFWCMVEPFETRPGIIAVISGYTGGHMDNPTYEQVAGGYTGHVEAVEIIFDTRVWYYKELVELYWQLTDPTDEFGQIADRGSNYRPVIFVANEVQQAIAELSKQDLAESGKYKNPIVTKIEPATTFWPAENFHQQFYQKNPKRYKKLKRSRQQFLAFQRMQTKLRLGFKRLRNKNRTH
ncbi:peptide methionine sulfoxide reductase [Listeria weihenstephanensis FSL R9-0317]|uniref:Peptide methionine sulfoxide reductase MsrA n=1 Tax=Listeria weihenstephanensis TaxID=1006155 RepID=A0A1S7FR73_9LIST|nr:peptide-methionine (S)-S-oxide reductase MsrA [Listeria weihenstephanensis]AQY49956.1 peptide methionine sulfoxide reductase [Listeria weihenstephanensis]EUJ39695.1 peptide methionine sulfoxide reductase [Listeria weihenstephanensis FSL R9-0317]